MFEPVASALRELLWEALEDPEWLLDRDGVMVRVFEFECVAVRVPVAVGVGLGESETLFVADPEPEADALALPVREPLPVGLVEPEALAVIELEMIALKDEVGVAVTQPVIAEVRLVVCETVRESERVEEPVRVRCSELLVVGESEVDAVALVLAEPELLTLPVKLLEREAVRALVASRVSEDVACADAVRVSVHVLLILRVALALLELVPLVLNDPLLLLEPEMEEVTEGHAASHAADAAPPGATAGAVGFSSTKRTAPTSDATKRRSPRASRARPPQLLSLMPRSAAVAGPPSPEYPSRPVRPAMVRNALVGPLLLASYTRAMRLLLESNTYSVLYASSASDCGRLKTLLIVNAVMVPVDSDALNIAKLGLPPSQTNSVLAEAASPVSIVNVADVAAPP